MLLRYAANDENPDVVAWSAGTLLNCAAGRGADFAAELLAISPPPVAALVGCLAPDVTDEKYDDAQVALYELQRANAAGALMNLVAVSDGVTAKLLECNGVKALADALAASREDALGAIAMERLRGRARRGDSASANLLDRENNPPCSPPGLFCDHDTSPDVVDAINKKFEELRRATEALPGDGFFEVG